MFLHIKASYCRALLSTTKITHKISYHKLYIPILLSLFTHALVLLISIKLLFTCKSYTIIDAFIYNSHILEFSLTFDWWNIFCSVSLILVLQYSTIFKGLVNSSKIVPINFRHYDMMIADKGRGEPRRNSKIMKTALSISCYIMMLKELLHFCYEFYVQERKHNYKLQPWS